VVLLRPAFICSSTIPQLNEEREKARRQLETERKALEVECADITAEFNTKLWALNTTRIKVRTTLCTAVVSLLQVRCS
jgi:hypothetical protein